MTKPTGRPRGRPPGREYDVRMELRLAHEMFERIQRQASRTGETTNSWVRGAVAQRLRREAREGEE